MSVEELSPNEVAGRLSSEPGGVYLDVRTEQEFVRGHPAGALNVPILHVDPNTGVPFPNEDFLAVVEANVPKDAAVYCGCASGQRSFQAAQVLLQAGYGEVYNVDGGFTGKRDPLGNLLQPGWQDLELPNDSGDGGDRSYEALRGRPEDL